MLISTASMLVVDINAFIRYDAHLGYLHLFYNISTTGFWSWISFSALLIILSYAAIWRTQKQFWKRVENTLGDEGDRPSKKNDERSERALKKLTRPLVRYINICLIGTALWVIFYSITHFVL
jgi:hypothetical protein